jgi:uncharacterized paraquat-inducible protein A
VNAALGIYALVSGDLGELERDVLFTSLTISGAGVLALACLPAAERGTLGPVPYIGMAAAVATSAVLFAVIWVPDPPQTLERIAWTLGVVAVTIAYGCVIGLASLAPRFRWAPWAALGLALVLGALVAVAIWGTGDAEWYGRTVGVVAVLLAAFTLLVPVLHRASRAEVARLAAQRAAGVRFCPSCGASLEATPGEPATCPRCGTRFTVVLSDSVE